MTFLHPLADRNLRIHTTEGNSTANVGNTLNIESLQDSQKQSSRGVKAGAQVEFGIGSSWQFSLNGSAQSGKSNYSQVNEQAGLFAEEGGYHVTANHVQLNGGAIASQNAQNSELTTNTIAFQDLKNESSSKAISGSLSASANRDEDSYVNRQGERVHPNTAGVSKVEGKTTPDFGGGLPMYESDADSGITKATLTEGRITLNKDTNPIQVTAASLGINTELNHAHQTVSKPKDVDKVLEEQNSLREAMAQVSKAAETYSRRQADSLNKEVDELAKQGKTKEAKAKRREAESWQTSGANKRKVEAVTTAITMATAGKPTEAIAVGAASPYVNQAIKAITAESETANIAAHILWGAIEAELSGNKAQTGAIAAATAELGARALTQAVYNKAPSELTPEEKETVLEISKAMAGVAVGVTDGGNAASVVTSVKTAADVAERAVENNLFGAILNNPQADWQNIAAGQNRKEVIEQEVREYIKKEHPVIYQTTEGAYYFFSKTGKVVYITREIVLDVAPFIIAPEVAAGTRFYSLMSRAALSGGANVIAQEVSGQPFNPVELTGAMVSGTVSPMFKKTTDVIRFNAGVGMATGLANGNDGLSDAALSGIATYGSMKISNPILATGVGEVIQKAPVIMRSTIEENNKDK